MTSPPRKKQKATPTPKQPTLTGDLALRQLKGKPTPSMKQLERATLANIEHRKAQQEYDKYRSLPISQRTQHELRRKDDVYTRKKWEYNDEYFRTHDNPRIGKYARQIERNEDYNERKRRNVDSYSMSSQAGLRWDDYGSDDDYYLF